MNDTNLAIVISASDKDTLKERKFGSVMSHAIHLGKHGKVFWQTGNPGAYIPDKFNYPDIKKGYFYVTSIQRVYYVCDIEFIKAHDEIEDHAKYMKYIPEWRKANWESQREENWGYWVLINHIQELKRLYTIDELDLIDTKVSMKAPPQAYSIIIDPEYEAI